MPRRPTIPESLKNKIQYELFCLNHLMRRLKKKDHKITERQEIALGKVDPILAVIARHLENLNRDLQKSLAKNPDLYFGSR